MVRHNHILLVDFRKKIGINSKVPTHHCLRHRHDKELKKLILAKKRSNAVTKRKDANRKKNKPIEKCRKDYCEFHSRIRNEQTHAENKHCHIETIATQTSELIQELGYFLTPNGLLNFALTCKRICSALENFHLRLDRQDFVFTKTDFQNHHRSNNRLTRWRISGAKFSACAKSYMWDILYKQGVKSVILCGTWESVDLSPAVDCKELEAFDSGTACHKIQNISHLRHCGKLAHLYLRNCDTLSDTSFLPSGNTLEKLSFYLCKSLRNISLRHCCSNLRVLDLGGCVSLRSIEDLRFASRLEKVSLADCTSLTDIEPLRGLSFLLFLDLTGCSGVENFSVLENLTSLVRITLKMCKGSGLLPLITSENEILSEESTNSLVQSQLWTMVPLLPTLREIASESVHFETSARKQYSHFETPPIKLYSSKNMLILLNSLKIIASVAQRDTENNTILIRNGFLPMVLHCIGLSCWKIREIATEILSIMAHNRSSVGAIVEHGAIEKLVGMVVSIDTSMPAARINTTFREAERTQEYAAAALLLIALEESQRQKIVEASGIEALIELLKKGNDKASVEAAGALWNLGATLEIGQTIVKTGAVPILIETLKTRPLLAKVQAAGALRNLAILESNKEMLISHDIVPVLIGMIVPGEVDRSSKDEVSLLSKLVATIRILCSNHKALEQISNLEAIPLLVDLLKLQDENMCRQVAGALLALSFTRNMRNLIAKADAIQELVRLVASDYGDATIISAAGCLWNLAMNDELERQIVKEKAIEALIHRLDSPNIEIASKAAGALKNLSYQQEHKELVASLGGIPKLIELIKDASSRALPYAVGALRLLASGSPATRKKIVTSGGIPLLIKLLNFDQTPGETVRLASGTLLHLADRYIRQIIHNGAVPYFIKLYFWDEAPELVSEEASYMLQRAATHPCSIEEGLRFEGLVGRKRQKQGQIDFHRLRGVPGDALIDETNYVKFYSYSSMGSNLFVSTGKIYYEVEIISVIGFPSFGWISPRFEIDINYLHDCGVGYPGRKETPNDSWAIDGVNGRKWPTKSRFGSPWKAGDIVTVAADIYKGSIIFGLNGSFGNPMGIAFENINSSTTEKLSLAPAISGSHGTSVRINFGKQEFIYPPPEADFTSYYEAVKLLLRRK